MRFRLFRIRHGADAVLWAGGLQLESQQREVKEPECTQRALDCRVVEPRSQQGREPQQYDAPGVGPGKHEHQHSDLHEIRDVEDDDHHSNGFHAPMIRDTLESVGRGTVPP